jgi:SAM-dependent methyltransferase
MKTPQCRSCGADLHTTFVDLGFSPLSNSYVPFDTADIIEPFYPLHAYVCERCFLVQLEAFETAERIFSDYAYFSSYSDSWLAHSKHYAREAADRLNLGPESLVVEAASNDGYLLQYFKERNIGVLGVEPAKNVAVVARERGIPTECVFLGRDSGKALQAKYGTADLVVANNVIAHVPDVHDFFGGITQLLGERGTFTVEFPHLIQLIAGVEFDTIYHEHFSYYSLYSLERLIESHGLAVYDVEKLPTHGGSLRVWMTKSADRMAESEAVCALRAEERDFGISDLSVYKAFAGKVAARKREFLRFLIAVKEDGKTLAGYGAPAKGNTLLNYCGVRSDFIDYTVDRNPAKQQTYLPGTRIPVYAPERLRETKPDFVVILPWNLRAEIVEQIGWIRDWGGRFVVPMPRVEVL